MTNEHRIRTREYIFDRKDLEKALELKGRIRYITLSAEDQSGE